MKIVDVLQKSRRGILTWTVRWSTKAI